MRKFAIWALMVVTLAGCGGKRSEKAESDSADEALMEEMVEAVEQASYITKDSVGRVAVGMKFNDVPDRVEGLYDRKEQGASPDAVTLTFSNSDGQQFVAYDFGEGNVDVINVVGRDVLVNAPQGDFGLGAPFSKVLSLPGVTAEWAGFDNGGTWYWLWEGLWFAPSQEGLSATLAGRLYHSGDAPTPADFDENVTVGFIGTGLPF